MKLVQMALMLFYTSFCLGQDSIKTNNYKIDSTLNRLEKSFEDESKNVYSNVEEKPIFKGGDSAMYAYLGMNIQYPQEARVNGVEGRVIVGFIVNTKGAIKDIRIVKSLGFGIDEEAIRLIKKMPKWTPGRIKGKPVNTLLNYPLHLEWNNFFD